MKRLLLTMLGCLCLLASAPAIADTSVSPPPTVGSDALTYYCIYENRLYSIGAKACSNAKTIIMQCKLATDNEKRAEQGPVGRAYWLYEGGATTGCP